MGAKPEEGKEDARVVFDGQCPFCRAYVASLDGNDNSRLNKINARCAPALVEQLDARDIDVNAGIVLLKGETIYQGAEALSVLARQYAAPNWFASLHHRLLRYRLVSLMIYPLLRAVRNVYLRLYKRGAIRPTLRKS